jgi:hypothetical protein
VQYDDFVPSIHVRSGRPRVHPPSAGSPKSLFGQPSREPPEL